METITAAEASSTAERPERFVRFGDHVLDRQDRALSRDGQRVPLRPKTYGLLEYLVGHAGRLVTKEELLDAVWPGVAVSDTVLKVCVRELREALGDDPRTPTFIATRHRVGYVFVASLRRDAGSHVPGPTPRTASVFVGRERELAALARALDAASEGGPGARVVFISGEPGMGKSALVEAFVRDATTRRADLAWCSGACVEQHGLGEPLHVFLEGMSALASAEDGVRERLRALAPAWCRELPGLFTDDERLAADALGARRERMMRELRAALGALPAGRSLVWILEDMHWADPSSVDLLRYLGGACRYERVLFIATFRPSAVADDAHPLEACMLELAARGQAMNLSVEPLTREEVGTYLGAVLGDHALDPTWCDLLAARTEGHPLFVASLIQLLSTTGGLVRGDDGRVGPALLPDDLLASVPPTVDAMVERKLAAIDASSRRTLAHAAVQGIELSSDVLARTLEDDPAVVEDRLDLLCRVHRLLMTPDERARKGMRALHYRFAHALYRDALYAGLAPSRRAIVHREVAHALLERLEPAEIEAAAVSLARHFDLGGEPEHALTHLGVVVETAERRVALAEADAACSDAFRLIDRLPEARRAAPAMRFHKRRAGLRTAANRFPEAIEDLAAVRAWARSASDPEAEIDALLQTFRQLGYMGRYQEAGEAAAEATSIADARGLETLRWQIDATVAALRGVRGELVAACSGLAAAFDGLSRRGAKPDLSLILDRGGFESMRGRYVEAGPWIDDALATARRIGDAFRVGAGLFWRTHALANRGRAREAFDALDEAIRLAERNEATFVLPRLFTLGAWLRRELGAFDDAVEWSRRALDFCDARMPDGRGHALLGLAIAEVGRGRLDEADASLREVTEILDSLVFSDWLIRMRMHGARARLALASGDLDRALGAASELRARAAEHGLGKHGGRASLLLAEIHLRRGEPERARAELDALDEELGRSSFALLAWRMHALRRRVLSDLGDPAGAESARRAGAAAIDAIAAAAPTPMRARIEAMAHSSGLRGL